MKTEAVKKESKKVGQTLVKFGAGAVGLTGGTALLRFTGNKLPATWPEWARNLSPGLIAMLAAYFAAANVDDDRLKSLTFGVGLAGFADALLKTLGPKIKLIQENVPKLSGTGLGQPGYQAINNGDFPPSYYKENAFQGLRGMGNNSFDLMGIPMNGIPMNGNGGYQLMGLGRLGNNAYALN